MKKNVMMRLASGLLVAVLLTTCAISGTFAKYVTEAGTSDIARVAKWGVVATVGGDAFKTQYDLDTSVAGLFTLAVESATVDKVVAPGTTGSFAGVSLTGTPEVAVRITKTATVTLTDWKVDGVYYCPIEVTINGTTLKGLDCSDAAEFAGKIKAAIEAANGDYEPQTNLATITGMNGDYSWAWAFNGDDVKDTKLGDKPALDVISIAVDVLVEQID